MTKPETNPNDEAQRADLPGDSADSVSFVIDSSFVIRLARRSLAKAGHSSF